MAEPSANTGRANLRPWKAGESGNPSGRPKWSVRDAMRAKLEKALESDAAFGDLTEEAASRYIAAAMAGDVDGVRAFAQLVEDVEGPHKQTFEGQVDVVARVVIDGLDDDPEEDDPSP